MRACLWPEPVAPERPVWGGVFTDLAASHGLGPAGHVHASSEVLIADAPLRLWLDGRAQDLEGPAVALIPAGVGHIAEPLERTRAPLGRFLALHSDLAQLAAPIVLQGAAAQAVLPPLAWLLRHHDRARGATASALAQHIIDEAGLLAADSPEARVLRHIGLRGCDAALGISELAMVAGLSPSQLRRRFASRSDSVLARLTQHRVWCADPLIAAGHKVAAIAPLVGYASAAGLYRALKRCATRC